MKKILVIITIFISARILFAESVFSKIISSLDDEYSVVFPEIITTKKYNSENMVLSDQDLLFYQKYAGSYIDGSILVKKNLLREIYRIGSFKEQWGIGYKIGKWSSTISYDNRDKKFYIGEGGCADQVKDLHNFNLPEKWVKMSGPNYTNPFLNDLITKKKKQHISQKTNQIQILAIHTLLKHFFINLEKKDYDSLLQDFNFSNEVSVINYDGSIKKINKDMLRNNLKYLYDCFENNDSKIEVL
jgi:hypothetical protein